MKIVITGGPCSGKTTIINELKRKGFFVMHEAARKIIVEKKYSRHLNDYKDEALHLQLEIFDEQMKMEKDLDKVHDIYPDPIFLDRGYIDNHVYCEHLLGYIPEEIKDVGTRPYDAVIILERLPFVDDGLRREDDSEAARLHEEIIQAYKDKGYDPIIIPAKNIKYRVKRVLDIMDGLASRPMEV